jgi:NAD(P)-dependent dehydrogenase (short-subunit alcohol dehydrogenase family)
MDSLSLKGKVVIVTGAGRGLGRAYALAMAARGARVVVNDLGTAVDGSGAAPAVAQAVADEIRAAGGEAVANGEDVGSESGGRAIVQQALDAFGRLDVLINNAGSVRDKPFMESTLADFDHHWRVHVCGHINVTRAAWPVMCRQKAGRIVMTASGAGLFGLRNESTYSVAKGAIHGLMRTLAVEGADHGILVNAIYPGGFTRMHAEAFPDPQVARMMREAMPCELVAPAIVWMGSDACNMTGQAFSVWSGRIARIVIGSGRGIYDRELTAEMIRTNLARILSVDELFEPVDGIDDVQHWQAEIAKD